MVLMMCFFCRQLTAANVTDVYQTGTGIQNTGLAEVKFKYNRTLYADTLIVLRLIEILL